MKQTDMKSRPQPPRPRPRTWPSRPKPRTWLGLLGALRCVHEELKCLTFNLTVTGGQCKNPTICCMEL